MEERVALIGIVVEKYESAERLNQILHEYGKYIIGRMGIPYKEKSMNIISVAVDAPMDIIAPYLENWACLMEYPRKPFMPRARGKSR